MNSFKKTYVLKLYVAGNTPNSVHALKTLKNILETEFKGVYARSYLLIYVCARVA
jgi:circadian clock protein KaiB